MAAREQRIDSKPLKVLRGINGQLEVYPDRLVIHRKWGLSNLGLYRQEKTIYPHQIEHIHCFEGRFLVNGSLRIVLKEGEEHTLYVPFNWQCARQAREVRDMIEDMISKNEPYPPFERA